MAHFRAVYSSSLSYSGFIYTERSVSLSLYALWVTPIATSSGQPSSIWRRLVVVVVELGGNHLTCDSVAVKNGSSGTVFRYPIVREFDPSTTLQ